MVRSYRIANFVRSLWLFVKFATNPCASNDTYDSICLQELGVVQQLLAGQKESTPGRVQVGPCMPIAFCIPHEVDVCNVRRCLGPEKQLGSY